MKGKYLLKPWAEITGKNMKEFSINKIENLYYTNKITKDEMAAWKLRTCDFPDSDYWMPYKITTDNKIKIYYMNLDSKSSKFSTILTLNIEENGEIVFREWKDSKYVERKAVIENEPTCPKPTKDDVDMISSFIKE
jgi:hypothetical protein